MSPAQRRQMADREHPPLSLVRQCALLGVSRSSVCYRPKAASAHVAVQEGLGGLRRIGFDETAVAVGQVQDEAVNLSLHAADDYQGLAEVALGLARRVRQRDKHLPCLAAVLPDVVLDHGVPAVETVLVPEPLEDALGRVALLLGNAVILVQDAVDHACEGLVLSLSKGWDAWV